MKTGWWLLATSGVLISAGVSAVVLAQSERRVVKTATQLLTLNYDGAAAPAGPIERIMRYSDRVSWIIGPNANMRDQRLVADYWRGHYGSLTSGAPERTSPGEDPGALLLTANAAYRTVKFDAGPLEVVEQLQAVLGQYAEVLKRDSSNFDAAYNYQFVARTRDRVGRAPRGSVGVATSSAPLDQTLHGRAGFELPGLEMDEFKVIAPQESDERREQQEAGKNAPRVRKG